MNPQMDRHPQGIALGQTAAHSTRIHAMIECAEARIASLTAIAERLERIGDVLLGCEPQEGKVPVPTAVAAPGSIGQLEHTIDHDLCETMLRLERAVSRLHGLA